MNRAAIGSKTGASLLAAAAGWAAGWAATLPMQLYQIVANSIGGRRALLWSLGAGLLIWLLWTLAIAAIGWLVGGLPAALFVREDWLLSHRRRAVAWSAALGVLTVAIKFRVWSFSPPTFSLNPWLFSLYSILLMVFAAVSAAVYLLLRARTAGAAATGRESGSA